MPLSLIPFLLTTMAKMDTFTNADAFTKKSLYICAPITGTSEAEILEQYQKIAAEEPDLIEWRADYFKDLADSSLVLTLLAQMKALTPIPILFTIRSQSEGGESIALSEDEKLDLLIKVAETSKVEVIDYEIFNTKLAVEKVRSAIVGTDKRLILSYHNFTTTPEDETLLEIAKEGVARGADMVKIAVMPRTKEEVFRLLSTTQIINQAIDLPIITIAMGDLGKISRVIGWLYGSIITFAVGIEASAPGQIPIAPLKEVIYKTKALLPSC